MAQSTTIQSIPAGYYAITGKAGEVRQYRVTVGKAGKWKGFRFIVRLIATGGHDFLETKIADRDHRDALLTYIGHHAAECSAAYGHLTNRCGLCNRVLSDTESIEKGIGPICAGKVGW